MKVVKRLTNSEEYCLMSPTINRSNLKKFEEKVLPYFFYNDESNRRIRNRLKNHIDDENNTCLDNLLKLNAQKRAFYLLEESEGTDEVYRYYCNRILHENKELDLPKEVKFKDLLDYNVFKSNKIKIGKQTYKLFKYIIDNKILREDVIKLITTSKTKNKSTYLCLSRNVIDYIFCSTNQSFTSCVSLEKSGKMEGLGLAGLSVDPNRFMCFTTQGLPRKYILRDQELDHFLYISRWWNLLGKRDYIYPIRAFGNIITDTREIIKSLKLKVFNDENKPFISKFSFDPIRYQNDDHSMIYLDSIGIKFNKSKEIFYSNIEGSTGSHNNFNSDWRFNQIENFEQLAEERYYCESCEDGLNEDTAFFVEGTDLIYCEQCYSSRYATCQNCDNEVCMDDSYRSPNDSILCESCFYDRYFVCDECNGSFDIDNRYETPNGEIVCEDCFYDRYFVCDECNESFDICEGVKDERDTLFCPSCYEELFKMCTNCDSETHIDEIVYSKGTNKVYCSDCYDKLFKECPVCSNEISTDYKHCVFCLPKKKVKRI
uniref:LIM zinc-binding domain-containing protein n=1 Tax=viral metagenome TaxID=1070528 RepID=A0A6H1ZQY2_9ZZZZ